MIGNTTPYYPDPFLIGPVQDPLFDPTIFDNFEQFDAQIKENQKVIQQVKRQEKFAEFQSNFNKKLIWIIPSALVAVGITWVLLSKPKANVSK